MVFKRSPRSSSVVGLTKKSPSNPEPRVKAFRQKKKEEEEKKVMFHSATRKTTVKLLWEVRKKSFLPFGFISLRHVLSWFLSDVHKIRDSFFFVMDSSVFCWGFFCWKSDAPRLATITDEQNVARCRIFLSKRVHLLLFQRWWLDYWIKSQKYVDVFHRSKAVPHCLRSHSSRSVLSSAVLLQWYITVRVVCDILTLQCLFALRAAP